MATRSSLPVERIAYGTDPFQFGDLRLPPSQSGALYPIVIVIHGGYWRARYDLEYFGAGCEDLAARGLATWNIEYRRMGNPGGGWPGTFLDVAGATDFLRALAQRYPLDLARVVALGHSAGGHLACWLAGRPRIPKNSDLSTPDPLPISGVVSLAGVVDLRRAWELQLSANATGLLLDGSPDDVPDRYAAASPYDLLPLGVRQIHLHGTADENVPYEISDRYIARARALGDDATLITLPDAGHFEMVEPPSHEWQAVAQAARELAM